MANPTLILNHGAQGAIPPHRIVGFGNADRTAKIVDGTADNNVPVCGVSGELGAEDGERIDIVLAGVADVEYGGTVSRGDPLVSDAQGRAVNANEYSLAATSIGFARISGVAGDIGEVWISPHLNQG